MKRKQLCLAALLATGLPTALLAQETTTPYPYNYSEDQTISHASRSTSSVMLAVEGATQTIDVDQPSSKKLVVKRLGQQFKAKAGESVTPSSGYNGEWMHLYVYLDKGRDGRFDVEYDGSGITNALDLVSYSYYKGVNSLGATASDNVNAINSPAFTVPEDLAPGFYRMRYKIDWDCADPAGNNGVGQDVGVNGGIFVDTRLNVHGDNVALSAVDAEGGEIQVDGAKLTSKEVAFGQEVAFSAVASDGYELKKILVRHGHGLDGDSLLYETPQYEDYTIEGDALAGGTFTIPAEAVDGDVRITPVFERSEVVPPVVEDDYALNFDKGIPTNTDSRKAGTFSYLTFVADGVEQSLNVPSDNPTVYNDLSETEIFAEAGSSVTAKVGYYKSGNIGGEAWMHAYLYADWNNDGKFDYSLGADGTPAEGSELVAFTYYNGKDSRGANSYDGDFDHDDTFGSLTMPEDLKPGVYRARLKMDWNNIDPAGSMSDSERIDANGGYIVDFLLNVHASKVKLDVLTSNGSVVGGGNTGLPEDVEFNKGFVVMPLGAAPGYEAQSITLRHGYNLDGEQYVHGNRQWKEDMLSVAGASEVVDRFVNGDLRITADFVADGSEEYKLVFADEFNAPDGTLPEAANEAWTRCTTEHPTWKRFTAQGAEAQAATAFIKDGKLVMRCVKNTFGGADEGKAMVSGAVESSSKFAFTYGKVEGRVRTTKHTGNFPAFWMMPKNQEKGWPDCGEIDIWEQINDEDKSYHTIHSEWANTHGQADNPAKSVSVETTAEEYHTYGFEWTETMLRWYVDGKEVHSYAMMEDDHDALAKGQWPFDKDFYLILNQSVGDGSWAAQPDEDFVYETKFDWVRVYRKDIYTPPTGISNVDGGEKQLEVRVADGCIVVSAGAEANVAVADVAGRSVYAGTVSGTKKLGVMPGIYVVNGKKVAVK